VIWPGNFGSAATGGRVYVGTESGPGSGQGHIYAFHSHCATSGRICKPVWVADTVGEVGVEGVMAEGGVIYATSLEQGLVEAFPSSCSATCHPLWVATDLDAPYPPVAQGGLRSWRRTAGSRTPSRPTATPLVVPRI
jgi:hypothetical protein